MPPPPHTPRPGISSTLTPNRLSAAALVFFALGAAAPLASSAGGTSAGWAITGIAQIPLAFVVTVILLLVFVAGYSAMSRHVTNAGAIYTYVARGLGRVPGVGAAFVALLAYSAMQIGLFGGIGSVAANFVNAKLGPVPVVGHLPWWLFSAIAWAVVFACGRLRVDVNGKVLGVLMSAECLLMLVFDAIMLTHPHGGSVTAGTLSPSGLATPAVAVAVVIAFTSFVGVEDLTNYSEESRRGTIGTAMVVSVLVGGAIYALSAWAMSVATGPDQVVGAARAHGSELMFTLVGGFVGGWMTDLGHLLFVTSLFASCLSFHNTTARYLFALGREGVLPRSLGVTSARTGSPKNASMAQSAIAAVVILIAAVAGWDPLVNMFFWLGTLAGLGVVALMTLASAAVVGFFARDPRGEHPARRIVLPVLAALSLGAVVVLTLLHYSTLLGVEPGDPAAWRLPALFIVLFVLGIGRGLYLYARRPEVYGRIGFGAETDGRADPTILTAQTAEPARGAFHD